ncbi:Antitoxin HigA1 [Mannheimia haemolytica]|uniref:helix-turn-helix domain-containing protein n=1 Tax=Mannheimia haemolytica TaxID=75985 RepID=UPI0031F5D23B
MKTLDQMLNELSPERRQKVEDMAQEMIREIQLSKLREELNLSQQQLATALGISQPAIAKLKQKDNDPRLSTLKRYIEAMGGKLKLAVELPTGDERVIRI